MKKSIIHGLYALILLSLPFLQGCPTYYYGDYGWTRTDWHYGRGWGYPGGWNRGGNWDRGGWGRDHGGGRMGGRPRLLAENLALADLENSSDSIPAEGVPSEPSLQTGAEHLAHDFDISVKAAERIIHLASRNEKERKAILAEVGLKSSDISALAHLKMPKKESLDKIALHLGEDPTRIEKVIQAFISDILAQKSARHGH